MKVTIWSSIAGPPAGYVIVDVPSRTTVLELLHLYCQQKAIKFDERWELRDDGAKVLHGSSTLTQAGVEHGDQLMLSPASGSSGVFQYGNWWTLALICLLIGLVGLSVVAYHASLPFTERQLPAQGKVKKYGVVVDAGSSHSSFFVFEWLAEKPLDSSDNLKLLHHCRRHGGLSSLIRQPSKVVEEYFRRCLQSVEASIPATARPHSSIYLAATAGMRILRDFDPSGAAELLAMIRETFSSLSSLAVLPDNVFIATGQQEGVNGWIATNYLLGALAQGNRHTEATLDVGGASLQLTRTFNSSAPPLPLQTLTLDILNVSYRLSSRTFMCFGILEARNRHHYLLLQDALSTLHYRPSQGGSGQQPQAALRAESQAQLKPEQQDKFQSEPPAKLGLESAYNESRVTRSSRQAKYHNTNVSSKENMLSGTDADNLETTMDMRSEESSSGKTFGQGGTLNLVDSTVDKLDEDTRRVSGYTPDSELVAEDGVKDVIVVHDPCSPVGYAKMVTHRSLLLPCTLTHFSNKKKRVQLVKNEVHQFHVPTNNYSQSSKNVIVSGPKPIPDKDAGTGKAQFVTSMSGSGKKYGPGLKAISPDTRSSVIQQKLETLLSNYRTVASNLNMPASSVPYEILQNTLEGGSSPILSAPFDQMLSDDVASAILFGRTANNLDDNSNQDIINGQKSRDQESGKTFKRGDYTRVNIKNDDKDQMTVNNNGGHNREYLRKRKRHIDVTYSRHLESFPSSSSSSVFPQHDGTETVASPPVFYRMEGTSDGEQCLELVEKIFDLETCRSMFHYGDCLDSSLVRPFSGNVLAFSDAFYSVSSALELTPNTTLSQFRQKVVHFCNLDLDQLKMREPNTTLDDPVHQHCHRAAYLYSLLTAGLGVTEETWQRVHFGKAVSQQPVEWTLGFMLHRVYKYYDDNDRDSDYEETRSGGSESTNDSLLSSSVPRQHEAGAAANPELVLLGLLFVAFLCVSVALACHAHRLAVGDPRYHRVLNDHIQAAIKV